MGFGSCARPRIGAAGSAVWAHPALDMREASLRNNGATISRTSMRIGRDWGTISAEPTPYTTTRRTIRMTRVALSDADGESHTLNSPTSIFRTSPNQMSFDQPELNDIGHWSSSSRMSDRYDRSVSPIELSHMDTITRKMKDGWELPPCLSLTGHGPSAYF